MEALVNIAYDRISEDIILLYDAMRAYNEVPSLRVQQAECINRLSWRRNRPHETMRCV